MSNGFAPTHNKQDAVVGTAADTETTTGGDRRRQWSSDDKARIVLESQKPGAVVSEVAQRYGLTRWQLYDWRRKARAATGESAEPGDRTRPGRARRNGSTSKCAAVLPAFAPVVMAAPAMPQQSTASEASQVEIAIGDVSVRVKGAVDVEGLVAVLNAVRRTS